MGGALQEWYMCYLLYDNFIHETEIYKACRVYAMYTRERDCTVVDMFMAARDMISGLKIKYLTDLSIQTSSPKFSVVRKNEILHVY